MPSVDKVFIYCFRYLMPIFICALLAYGHAPSAEKASNSLFGFSLFEIGFDKAGRRIDGVKIRWISEPVLGPARIGAGVSAYSIYEPYQIPKLKWANDPDRPSGEWPNEMEYESIFALLPLSVYLVPFPVRDVMNPFLYWDFWPIQGVCISGKKPPDFPMPSPFSETGIGLNPFGELVTLKVFYRKISIPSREGVRESNIYSFPGYKEDFIGVGVNLYLGIWAR